MRPDELNLVFGNVFGDLGAEREGVGVLRAKDECVSARSAERSSHPRVVRVRTNPKCLFKIRQVRNAVEESAD
jgi:hypothetical protein